MLRFQIGLYTANLRANTTVVHDLVFAREPHPATVVLDLSRLPRMTSTILDGFRDLDAELAGKGVRLVCANLSGPMHHSAQQEQWWQGVESQGRYFDTLEAAVEHNT